ncbi:hypothetical protein DQ04_13931000, partial [Trypanosoma grayi]|uniref:hypothetical protein n=1 Tax=Trypanosoma grayi TaxID=71804 RepID=UPI0004F49720
MPCLSNVSLFYLVSELCGALLLPSAVLVHPSVRLSSSLQTCAPHSILMVTMARHLLPLLALALCCTSLCAAAGPSSSPVRVFSSSRRTRPQKEGRRPTVDETLSKFLLGHGSNVRDLGRLSDNDRARFQREKKPTIKELSAEEARSVYSKSSLAVSMVEKEKKGMEEAVNKATESNAAAKEALNALTVAYTTAAASVREFDKITSAARSRRNSAVVLKKHAQDVVESINKTLVLSALAIIGCSDVINKTRTSADATNARIEQLTLTLGNIKEMRTTLGAADKNTADAEKKAGNTITRANRVLEAARRAERSADAAKAKLAEAVGNAEEADKFMTTAKGYITTDPTRHLLGAALNRGWRLMETAASEAQAAMIKAETAFKSVVESLTEAEEAKKHVKELEEIIKAVQEAAEAELKKHPLPPEGLAVSQTQGESLQQSQQEESAQQSGSQDSTVSTVDPTSGEVSHPSSPAVLAPAVPAPSPAAPGAAGA